MTATTTVDALLERYDAVLLDAYGVLVTGDGALPGAPALVGRLTREGRPWYVVTNAASHVPEHLAERFARLGVPVPAERIISSGAMLAHHLVSNGLAGRRCAVLGPAGSADYVRRGGGDVVALEDDFDVLCVCDEAGGDFLADAEAALSGVCRAVDTGRDVTLLLTNPDVIYPTAPGRFGFTAGALALLIQRGLELRYAAPPRFTPLGKPEPVMFRRALELAGTANAVMIGDQRHTDILGAHRAGIDNALVASGVASADAHDDLPAPDWLLAGLS
ncbi:Ribonucleotide monophosphatase NagD [wastewater metagenome]|uniref:Ribonucleotide monophosphatase NagD n=2 Tax=unclassified sequences TaxID=12908 RepID=A0A5B8R9M6_9ZZZZ|nr:MULTISPECIES: HAD-IA family hydrolase [Arhodomonas]MCS4502622.1 HAD-IA family hydrolase [Arhodomonas aquaeolei]QEA05281.1 ribonucleotide monophosphatase NagD [uncultured organism]